MPYADTPSRLESFPAYALSALTTLLWVAAVLPAGALVGPVSGDEATPLHRGAILLTPALLLLIAIPAGCMLSRRARGLRAVLAGTDAFVVTYVALALWSERLVFTERSWAVGPPQLDIPMFVASLLLLCIGALSMLEAWRCTRAGPSPKQRLSGLRLAICLLVLILPLHILLRPDVERASLLAPFLFVAISAGGVRLARNMRGLRRTAAVVQFVLAAHVLVTIRYTIYRSEPTITDVNVAGRVAMGLAIATAALALLQVVLLLRRGQDDGEPAEPAEPQTA